MSLTVLKNSCCQFRWLINVTTQELYKNTHVSKHFITLFQMLLYICSKGLTSYSCVFTHGFILQLLPPTGCLDNHHCAKSASKVTQVLPFLYMQYRIHTGTSYCKNLLKCAKDTGTTI